MPITSLAGNNQKTKSSPIANILVYIAGIIGVGLAVYFGGEILKNIQNVKGKAGLKVDALYGQYEVLINDVSLGNTPVDAKDIKPGLNKITIKNSTRQYDTSINFLPKDKYTHTIGIFKDLGVSDVFSSGQELWFEKDSSGNTLRVLSEPSGASVYIDKVEVGKTPFSSNTVSEGEYDLSISLGGCEPQTTRINVKKGFTLNVNAKLFPVPAPEKIETFADSPNIYNVSIENPMVISDTKAWAQALKYWIETRGVTVGDKTANRELTFDYFIDYKGNIFDKDANQISNKEDFSKLKEAKNGAYLGRTADGQGITKEAREILEAISGSVGSGKTATIKSTPTGWLRVRSDASINASELARVDTGGKYPVLETKSGWVKIKVSDTVQGWVSADYVTVN